MASKKSNTVVIGPTMAADGLPPNPADAIREKGVPLRPAQDMLAQGGVIRRPFRMVTRNPLRYAEGPGTDEQVIAQHDTETGLYGPDSMEGGRRPAPNTVRTTQGQEIRGT